MIQIKTMIMKYQIQRGYNITSQIQLEYLEELKKFTKLQDEVYIEVIRCKKSEDYSREQLEFIRDNHLNAWHLWEDSEEGDKATKDYEALILHGIEVKKKYLSK